jgi:methionine synthase / methylenetetrahydrofolate reductase (NADH)
MNLLDELESRVVCGDGAMGTLLLDAGVPIERCFEELCISDAERIQKIHEDYVAAGARVIETNTFGANAVRLERFGLEECVREINHAAVRLAKGAAKARDIYIAGSVGPLGITADDATARSIDRENSFREQISALLDAGVDLIFFETFTDVDEIEIALRAKKELSEAPEICSIACGPSGRLPGGILLVEAFAKIREMDTKILGVNCMNAPREMAALFQQLPGVCVRAVYPTAGQPRHQNGRLHYDVTPELFAASVSDLVEKGVRLLGGCCGTTPAHIATLAAAIANLPR